MCVVLIRAMPFEAACSPLLMCVLVTWTELPMPLMPWLILVLALTATELPIVLMLLLMCVPVLSLT